MTRSNRTMAEGALPKLCGADIELGNCILGLERRSGTAFEASKALLREFKGVPGTGSYATACDCAACRASKAYYGGTSSGLYGYGSGGYSYYDPRDWGRKFLPANGGCVYIDLDHLELCIPEVLSAFDHVAAWHAMLLLAREAMEEANARLPKGQRLCVLVNNSDGAGNSYGSHLNFLITRRCFENIFERKLHHQAFLASYLVSSICFSGAGKVGSENGRPAVSYQLTQRGDFFECLCGPQTTYKRPIVNSRDEALAEPEMARLHVIFFDNTLCHGSSLLKVGVTQVVLAMLEQEQVPAELILDDPLGALLIWGHDPSLCAKARLVSGARCTAVEAQLALLDRACRFVATGRADGLIPRVQELMALWEDTLLKLKCGDHQALAPRLDWVLKRRLIERTMRHRPELTWDSPQAKHLDHLYSSLDPNEGLYWATDRDGAVQRLVSPADIERLAHEPPADTRAWLRATLLRSARDGEVQGVDWDRFVFRFPPAAGRSWSSYVTLEMPDPLSFTKAEWEQRLAEAGSLEEAVRTATGPDATQSRGAQTYCLPAPVADSTLGAETPGGNRQVPETHFNCNGGTDNAVPPETP